MLVNIANLLPYLAIAGLALEAAPVSAHGVQRHPRDRHMKHIERKVSSVNARGVGAGPKPKIMRRADGSQCRVRPATTTLTATAAAADETSASTDDSTATADAAPAADTTAAAAADDSSASSSSESATAAALAADPTTDSSSSSPEASATSSASDSTYTAVAATSGASTNTGSKFGAAWPNGDYASSDEDNYMGKYVGSRTSWYYTWAPGQLAVGDTLGLEFIPMLWGPAQVSDWWSTQGSWPSSTKNALFFNEPNEASQCNMDIYSSISYWMNDYLPVRKNKGLRLGAAATTSAPSGLTWVTSFPGACTGAGNAAADCAADFVPVHWYDVSASDFQTYLTNFHTQTNLPIWVTEYACQNFNGGAQCSESETWSLHQTMASWMDGQDWIERYAPFGMMRDMQGVNQDNALMNPSGSITDLGSWYINSS